MRGMKNSKQLKNALMIKLFSIIMARDSFELAAQLIWWMGFFSVYIKYQTKLNI